MFSVINFICAKFSFHFQIFPVYVVCLLAIYFGEFSSEALIIESFVHCLG